MAANDIFLDSPRKKQSRKIQPLVKFQNEHDQGNRYCPMMVKMAAEKL